MAQAMSGIMSVTGYPGGPPVKAGVPVADIGCGLFAIYGVLSAYIGAKATGKGQYIDASLFDSALAFSIWDISQYWGTGEPPEPLGTANRMSAPYQAVKAADGYFVMGATSQKLWKQLCNMLGHSELIDDPRFATVSLRLANRPELIALLEQSFAARNCESWIDEMLAVGIPAGPILTYPQAFESEHGRNREMRIEIDHPIEGKVPNIGFPVKFSGTPAQVRLPPPLLGEHTAAVLAELGFDASQQAKLEAEGAFSA
jgi:formyl-CoA transferase